MTDGDALLRAVCEAPRDDAPRLIYADWLQERGHDQAADFIRAMRRPRPVPVRMSLSAASADLVPCDQLQGTCAEFMARAGDVFRRHPVTKVVLTDREPWEQGPNPADPRPWFFMCSQFWAGVPRPSWLPHELAGHFPRESVYDAGIRDFPTRDEAEVALSDACVAYGRQLAGLPPLEGRP